MTKSLTLKSDAFYRSGTRLCVFLTILLGAITFIAASTLRADEIADFKKEALAIWEKRFTRAGALEAACDWTSYWGDYRKVNVHKGTKNLYLLYPCVCVESSTSDYGDVVECFNSRYHFRLSKKTDASEWRLDMVERIERNFTRKEWARMKTFARNERFGSGCDPAYDQMILDLRIFPEATLPDLFLNPYFVVSNLRRETDSGRDVVRFDFDFDTSKESNYMQVRSGTITLDAKTYSILTAEFDREDYSFTEPGAPPDVTLVHYKTTIEYGEIVKNMPPSITRRTMVHHNEKGEEDYREEDSVAFKRPTGLSKDRFTLSYYGFEEPHWEDEPPVQPRWILLAVGAALIVGAILLTRRRSKQEAA